MNDRETRCTFETMGTALRCRYSDGHPGPHVFIWIPGTEPTSEIKRLRAALKLKGEATREAQNAVGRYKAEAKRLTDWNDALTKSEAEKMAEVERLRAAIEKVEHLAQSVIDKYDGEVEAPYDIYVLRDILRNALAEEKE